DKWQNRGVGTFLLQFLIRAARRNGIRGFTAEVLTENKPMQAVFNKSNCRLKTDFSGNVISYRMEFE
ncbi:MAG: GNAT family N-acetyltransferase, partial [Verrucomicrobiae bacterium]|nr:GNAT family N-acetyltransferase [Verrucomicrobiae bacterium]